MIIQIVRFESRLPDDEVHRVYKERAPRYRALPDLGQKYYLRFTETGEHGAVYVWDSEEALSDFHESDLYRTIPEAYEVRGTPDVQDADVVMTLREVRESEPSSR
ncbi:MAG: hypothetical protein PVJ80_18030 [Gemmatimonadota bacterium]|jgi:hypothetical protein